MDQYKLYVFTDPHPLEYQTAIQFGELVKLTPEGKDFAYVYGGRLPDVESWMRKNGIINVIYDYGYDPEEY